MERGKWKARVENGKRKVEDPSGKWKEESGKMRDGGAASGCPREKCKKLDSGLEW